MLHRQQASSPRDAGDIFGALVLRKFHARECCEGYCSNLASRRSKRVMASAVAPAKPTMTSPPRRRSFFTLDLMTCCRERPVRIRQWQPARFFEPQESSSRARRSKGCQWSFSCSCGYLIRSNLARHNGNSALYRGFFWNCYQNITKTLNYAKTQKIDF